MAEIKTQDQSASTREKFIEAANRGKILANRCSTCGHSMLETVIFCEKCFGNKFEAKEYDGRGTVVTYTIQAVAPEGFEDVGPYAWVVFKLDDAPFRASGFLPGVSSPSELPIGSKVGVSGFDPNHGLLLKSV